MVRRETVLYYSPEKGDRARRVKSVLVRMGVRIRNIGPEQLGEQVGYLAGMDGFLSCEERGTASDSINEIGEEVLVLHHFTERRLDELLRGLRRADASVALKAIVTESNCGWSFYELYEEISKEHALMSQGGAPGAQPGER